MVAALVFILVFIVLIAVFIGKNLGNSCPVWFFKSFESTNVAIIIFIAFAAGIVFSLFCILISKLISQSKKSNHTNKDDKAKEQNEHKKNILSGFKKTETIAESSENKNEDLEIIEQNDAKKEIRNVFRKKKNL